FQPGQVRPQARDVGVAVASCLSYQCQSLVEMTPSGGECPLRLAGAGEVRQVAGKPRITLLQMAACHVQGLPSQFAGPRQVAELPVRIRQANQVERLSDYVRRCRASTDRADALDQIARCQVVAKAGMHLN